MRTTNWYQNIYFRNEQTVMLPKSKVFLFVLSIKYLLKTRNRHTCNRVMSNVKSSYIKIKNKTKMHACENENTR